MNKIELARNRNTQPNVLKTLATDEELYVRLNVAINPNTPSKALEQLATDEDEYVRYCVAINPNIPKYIKTYLKYQRILKCYEQI